MGFLRREEPVVTNEMFLNHMNKEEKAFEHLIKTLDSIKEELHKTNAQMSDYNSSQKLALLKTKSEILETVFARVVKKDQYDLKIKDIQTDITNINLSIQQKVNKSEVKLVWGVIVSALSFLGWLYSLRS